MFCWSVYTILKSTSGPLFLPLQTKAWGCKAEISSLVAQHPALLER